MQNRLNHCRLLAGILLAGASCSAGAARAAELGAVEYDVPVTMRDGVTLRADIHHPEAAGVYPVLLDQTPYGRKSVPSVEPYVRAGYIVVVEDIRGRYASEGIFESFVHERTHEAEDGYDSVEWAARIPGSTGRVGTFGPSYDAFEQWKLAALRPPSLAAMAASAVPAHLTDLEGPGAFRPGIRLKWWSATMAPDLRRHAGLPGPYLPEEALADWNQGENHFLWFLPWLELPDALFGTPREAEAIRAWMRHPAADPWQFDRAAPKIGVPNLCHVGWYDQGNGSIDIHLAVTAHGGNETARRHQRLIIGPWSHRMYARKLGEVDFGPTAEVDVASAQIRWFDHWLRGVPNGVDRDPPVRIFVMGANRWRDEAEWPLARAVPFELDLTSDGQAETPAGNGRLERGGTTRNGSDRFRYDPRDPVPSLVGKMGESIPAEQGGLRYRRDILVYQTRPLAGPIEVTGYPEVELYAASSAPDTDFVARLIDVAPDGRATDLAMGIVRARFREALDRPRLLVPGEITRFRIRLRPTSIEFQKGHRIRLDITSSDFPNYDRNHNTAADQNGDAALAVAAQTVFYGADHRSRLVLPTIPPATGRLGASAPSNPILP